MTATMTRTDAARDELTPLLKIEDLERLLRVDRRTIARLCKRGELPAPLKVGGGNRWRMRDSGLTLAGCSGPVVVRDGQGLVKAVVRAIIDVISLNTSVSR